VLATRRCANPGLVYRSAENHANSLGDRLRCKANRAPSWTLTRHHICETSVPLLGLKRAARGLIYLSWADLQGQPREQGGSSTGLTRALLAGCGRGSMWHADPGDTSRVMWAGGGCVSPAASGTAGGSTWSVRRCHRVTPPRRQIVANAIGCYLRDITRRLSRPAVSTAHAPVHG
jgi:hypothetical protein